MRDRDVGKVGVDSFHDLIIILRHTLELEIKVIEPGDELHSRRVAFDDDELLGEDAVDDKTALVMLQSGLTKHLVEADMLLFIEPERILVTRRSELPAGLVCQFSVGIHIWLKKGARQGSDTGLAGRAVPLSDKLAFVRQRYSSLLSGDNKNPRRKFFVKTLKNLRYGFRGRVFPGCNITTVRAPKQALGADWSGRGRTSKPRYFSRWYLAS